MDDALVATTITRRAVCELLQRIKRSRRELVEGRATDKYFNRYFDHKVITAFHILVAGFHINPLYIRERISARAAKDTAVIEQLAIYSRNSSFGGDSFLVAISFQEFYVCVCSACLDPDVANDRVDKSENVQLLCLVLNGMKKMNQEL